MDAMVILLIVLFTLGATIVFYAAHSPLALGIKTLFAAVGFLVIFITAAFTGIY